MSVTDNQVESGVHARDWELTYYRLKECSDEAVTKGEGGQGEENDLPPLAVVVAMPTGDRFTSCAGGELHCDWYCGAAKSTSALAEVGVVTFLVSV
ncbi:hypothetical protein J6590_073903 [Homalodisca vitripennis]|nr:hypothetical protein J6590_073903 [Homalodisca vitripennis]